MDLQEYELIKGYTSYELDNWSLQKYGPVLYNYQDNRGKRVGLHRHHIGENKIPNLCSAENQQKYPEEQQANRLRYYDLIEHCYRHLLDAEECIANKVSPTGSLLGVGGYYTLRRLLLENPTHEMFELIQRFDNRVIQLPIVFEYNQQAFQQALKYLETKGKALIVIGTGLGKTPSGLEAMRVLIQENIHSKTLVLANKNDILDSSWSGYEDFIDIATYQSLLTNDHLEEDAKKYNLIICDEAHHMNNNKWSEQVALLCQYNPNIKLLGLTATPETAQDQNDLDLTTCQTFFDGNVCIGMSLLQAIEENIVWPFKYRIGIFEERTLLEDLGLTNNDIQKYNLDLDNLTWINQLTKHMPKTPRKGLIFVSKISKIDSIITSLKQLFPSFDIRPYHSKQDNQEHQDIKDWFDKTDQGFLVSVDQLSEGYHPRGINTLIMLRSTSSSIVYRQQIGRITQLKRFIQDDPDGIVFDFINNYAHLEDAYEFGCKLKQAERILKQKNYLSESDELIDTQEIETLKILKQVCEQQNLTWSKQEETNIINYCEQKQKENQRYIIKELQILLPRRSHAAIIWKIGQLGLSYKRIPWTEQENDILCLFYPDHGADEFIQSLLPGRSVSAILQQANFLGLICRKHLKYTDDQKALIEQLWPHGGLAAVKPYFPDRSDQSLQCIASELGVTMIDPNINRKGVGHRAIIVLDTNTLYNSMADACAAGIGCKGDICKACQTPETRRVHGLHVVYSDSKYADNPQVAIKFLDIAKQVLNPRSTVVFNQTKKCYYYTKQDAASDLAVKSTRIQDGANVKGNILQYCLNKEEFLNQLWQEMIYNNELNLETN